MVQGQECVDVGIGEHCGLWEWLKQGLHRHGAVHGGDLHRCGVVAQALEERRVDACEQLGVQRTQHRKNRRERLDDIDLQLV